LSFFGSVTKRPFLTIGILAVLGLAACYHFGTIAARPAFVKVETLASNEQRFLLTADDGVKTAASFFPVARENAPGVLLFHGVTSSRSQFKNQIAWLNAAGFAALAIDFRGHGESDQVPRSFGLLESQDAKAAFDWLKAKQNGARIGAIGVSLGGAATLLGKEGALPVDALVLQAVYPDIRSAIHNRIAARAGTFIGVLAEPVLSMQSIIRYGVWPSRISPINAARTYQGRVLVIGGMQDFYTPASETRALAKAFSLTARLWLIPGLDHAAVSSLNTPMYRLQVLDFLERTLKSP
jgi:uncharacterized protein